METITGRITGFNFKSDTFCVAGLEVNETGDYITAVGVLMGNSGQDVELTGEWVDHSTYGRQFKVARVQIIEPTTREGLIAYLSSGLLRGVGESLAGRIYDKFGAGVTDILDGDAEEAAVKLRSVKGLGKKTAPDVVKSWQEHRAMSKVMIYLQGFGVAPGLAARVYKAFPENTMAVIQKNPYHLTTVSGFGFVTADSLARSIGIPADSHFRAEAAVRHVLTEAAENEGHLYLLFDDLAGRVTTLLGDVPVDVPDIIAAMARRENLVVETIHGDETVWLKHFHRREVETARKLGWLMNSDGLELQTCVRNSTLSDTQREAVDRALSSKVSILTGGPGTGKTTTIRTVLDNLDGQAEAVNVALAAPTGRAAKRMAESTGRKAVTLHRLLGASPGGSFEYGKDNPLPDIDFLIVDEASMIDEKLFHALLTALPDSAHLLLVGDSDQLPSVGPGNILRDLIAGGIPCIHLDTIFRQTQDSTIVYNAHRINRGEMPIFPHLANEDGQYKNDFFWFPAEAGNEAAVITDIVANRIPAKFGIPSDEIQVLSPMHKGSAGVSALNESLQQALNERGERIGKTEYRVGDRVIQTRNNYEGRVFNGDAGRITRFVPGAGPGTGATIDFGDAEVTYALGQLGENIKLAYAMTIHKSQGSEYPAVVIPVVSAHYIMLARNLLYTGITRASQLVVLVGNDKKPLAIAVNNNQVAKRQTNLAGRL